MAMTEFAWAKPEQGLAKFDRCLCWEAEAVGFYARTAPHCSVNTGTGKSNPVGKPTPHCVTDAGYCLAREVGQEVREVVVGHVA